MNQAAVYCSLFSEAYLVRMDATSLIVSLETNIDFELNCPL